MFLSGIDCTWLSKTTSPVHSSSTPEGGFEHEQRSLSRLCKLHAKWNLRKLYISRTWWIAEREEKVNAISVSTIKHLDWSTSIN